MEHRQFRRKQLAIASVIVAAAGTIGSETIAQRTTTEQGGRDPGVRDPGVRPGPAGAGGQLPGLSEARFNEFKAIFDEDEGVEDGLGPRFNLDSCGGCHFQPATGGSSGLPNPQITVAAKAGAHNRIPWFLSKDGPIREARRITGVDGAPDGRVVPLFVITGRNDAPRDCNLAQPDFSNKNNFSFRIPTPVFGTGLIEAIPDKTLRDSLARDTGRKRGFGIRGRLNTSPEGRLNTSGNDGTVTRFGWKAQNKSALVFAGEAYNVEMGITSDLFPNEIEDTCATNGTPEDAVQFKGANGVEIGDVLPFAAFMRFLDQPKPAPETNSTRSGRGVFEEIGCALCHTPTLMTGKSSVPALSNKAVNLFSDLAVHNMGPGLADGITQGQAGPTADRLRAGAGYARISWSDGMAGYERYQKLQLSRPEPGVLEIAMGAEGKLAVADAQMHRELADIWRDVDADPDTAVAILRGIGKGFSGGGSLDMWRRSPRASTSGRRCGARRATWSIT
jgi:hypothetical protein